MGGKFTQVVLVFLFARCLVSGDFGHSDVRLLEETPLPCAALIGNKYVNKKENPHSVMRMNPSVAPLR